MNWLLQLSQSNKSRNLAAFAMLEIAQVQAADNEGPAAERELEVQQHGSLRPETCSAQYMTNPVTR